MNRRSSSRYFDLSTLLALGFAAFLLVSLPGGCGDSEDEDDSSEVEGTDTEEVAEATEVPMMEIVEPEPGDLITEPQDPEEDDAGEEQEDTAPDEGDGETEESNSEDDPAAQDGSYVVQQGDTLYGIAVDFGVSMEDLMAANDMDNPDQLQVGQELQIP
ncbi:MAG: LysM peptidoglycan-binding domain-containing protein [Thermomicrobiaceae bacterium]